MTSLLVAAVVSFALVGATLPLLRRAQFVDVPNHRSSHKSPIPRGGGVAVMIAITVALFLARDFEAWPAVIAAAIIALVGLADDMRSLPGAVRLVAQVAVSLGVVGWLLVEASQPWWVAAPAVVVLVGFVNAFNFMDGVNGISALTAVVAGAYWAIAGALLGFESIQALGLVLAGAAIGFLPWNAPRARVFLGDVGSYGLGFLIGFLSLAAWAQGASWLLAVAPLVVYGADTGWVLVKRLRGRRPLMEAHREHVYQRLVDGGWSHSASAGLCGLAAVLVCASVAVTWRSAPVAGAALSGCVVLAYLSAPRVLVPRGGDTA